MMAFISMSKDNPEIPDSCDEVVGGECVETILQAWTGVQRGNSPRRNI